MLFLQVTFTSICTLYESLYGRVQTVVICLQCEVCFPRTLEERAP